MLDKTTPQENEIFVSWERGYIQTYSLPVKRAQTLSENKKNIEADD